MKHVVGLVVALLAPAVVVHADLPDAASARQAVDVAPVEVQTQNGIRFVSGGVGDQEQDRLRVLSDDYNLPPSAG